MAIVVLRGRLKLPTARHLNLCPATQSLKIRIVVRRIRQKIKHSRPVIHLPSRRQSIPALNLRRGPASQFITMRVVDGHIGQQIQNLIHLPPIPGFLQRCLDRIGGGRYVAAASSLALAIRLGPLALAEVRTMWGLSRQRRPLRRNGRPRGVSIETLLELLLLATVQSCRRAGELADAIASRGGLGAVAQPDRGPSRLDGAVVLGAVVLLTAGVVLGGVFPGMVD